jgi:drug/metabolite transporter (DMT)-like permease
MPDECNVMQAGPDLFFGIALGLISSVLFAIQSVLFKSQKEGISPTAANTIKMWIGLVVIVVVAVLPFRPPTGAIPFDTALVLAISVLFGAVLGDLAFLTSQNRVGVSVAFPIVHTFPVFTYFFSMLFLGEQFYITRLVGIILAVLGVIYISKQEDAGREPDDSSEKGLDMIGIALAVLSSVLLSIATLLIQVGMTEIDPVDGNLIRMFYGSLVMVPIFILSRKQTGSRPTKEATKVILIGSLVGFAFGSLLFVASIKFAGATITAVVSTTAPLFALPLSFLHLKEHITSKVVGGTVITVIGVALAVLGVW